jgi:hypothetical protein
MEFNFGGPDLSACNFHRARVHVSALFSHLELMSSVQHHMARAAAILSPCVSVRTALPYSTLTTPLLSCAVRPGRVRRFDGECLRGNVLHRRPFRRATSSPPLSYSSLAQDLAEPPRHLPEHRSPTTGPKPSTTEVPSSCNAALVPSSTTSEILRRAYSVHCSTAVFDDAQGEPPPPLILFVPADRPLLILSVPADRPPPHGSRRRCSRADRDPPSVSCPPISSLRRRHPSRAPPLQRSHRPTSPLRATPHALALSWCLG